MKRTRSLNSWPGGCLVRESPDTPGSVLPTRALACQYELLHGEKMFAPVAKLWGACASRVLALASSPSRTPFFWAQNSIAEAQKVRFCATQKPGRRGDRYPINCVLGPWRRSGTPPCCRIRPRSRTRPRRNRRSSRRCRRRRRRLIGEDAAEMLEGAPGEEAHESACRDIHEVWALYHRRGIEVEGY